MSNPLAFFSRAFAALTAILALMSAVQGAESAPAAVRVFMIGDSTMANKPESAFPEIGWGQVLPRFFEPSVTIENHAVNGRSSKSFRDEGRWDPILEKLQPGDFVIIQFGHNDEKSKDPTRYADPATDYPANLARYAREARERGAEPILATSICRRKYDEQGAWVATHGAYPDAVRRVAAELNVPLADLQALTKELLIELGSQESIPMFMHVIPGVYAGHLKGKIDDTHLVEMGALKVASLFAAELRRLGHPLANHLKSGD